MDEEVDTESNQCPADRRCKKCSRAVAASSRLKVEQHERRGGHNCLGGSEDQWSLSLKMEVEVKEKALHAPQSTNTQVASIQKLRHLKWLRAPSSQPQTLS